ncbi:MAG: Ig-like domain-containing protein [Clostridia bacterium]|nr:Ig-like domain-containing protein [Clostridia bacterium]
MKRKNVLLLLSTVASLAFAFGVAACDNGNQTDNVETYEYKMDRPTYFGKEGEVLKLNIFTDNPSPVITWSSDKESVATVSATGEVTMKTVGQAKITATVDGKNYVCNLTVEERLVEFYFDAEKVEISTIQDEFETSQTLSLTVDVNFETLETPNFIWTTGDSSVARVENGTVTAVGKGFTTVTASIIVDGKTYASSLNVSVYPKYEFVDKDVSYISVSDLNNEVIAFEAQDVEDIEYVKLGDTVLNNTEYAVENNQLLVSSTAFSKKKLGRQTLTMAVAKDEMSSFCYQYPLVVATYVVREAADLSTMYEYMSHEKKDADEYIVLAADIDYGGATFKTKSSQPSNGALTWYGTFDGYGHTISNMIIGKWGFVCAVMEGTVKDLALINVTGNNGGHGGLLVGTLNGTAENCFVSGSNKNGVNAGMIARTMGVNSRVTNCIVVDAVGLDGRTTVNNVSALAGYAGASTKNPANTVENTLVVTNGICVIDSTTKLDDCTEKWSGITKIAGNNADVLTEELLKGFDGKGNWEYDETTRALKLMGNVIHRIVIAENLKRQFAEINAKNTVSLSVDCVVDSLQIDGVMTKFTQTENVITFTYSATGEHVATVKTSDYKAYNIPFVLANHLISTVEDLSLKDIVTSSTQQYYIAVTNNIDCESAVITPATVDFNGTLNGFGYTIKNASANMALFTTKNCFANVKNVVLMNVTLTNVRTNGVFGGTVKGKIENCFVSGSLSATTQAGLLGHTLEGASVENCIVIDINGLNGTVNTKNLSALGGLDDVATAQNLSNILCVTNGIALWDKTAQGEYNCLAIKKLSGNSVNSLTAEALKAFAGKGEWTFDETSGELKLCGNTVYTISKA